MPFFKKKRASKEQAAENSPHPLLVIAPQLAEIFVRDATRTLRIIDDLERINNYNAENLRKYLVQVHGMKTVLASIGEMGRSEYALRLERAAHEKNMGFIKNETPKFLADLRNLIAQLTPLDVNETGVVVSEKDYEELREKLVLIKDSCATYDRKTAKETLLELRQRAWSPGIKSQLAEMNEHLLSGDFIKVCAIADKLNTEENFKLI